MTTPAETERFIFRAGQFLEFLAGYRSEYAGNVMLNRDLLVVPQLIREEAARLCRHYPRTELELLAMSRQIEITEEHRGIEEV